MTVQVHSSLAMVQSLKIEAAEGLGFAPRQRQAPKLTFHMAKRAVECCEP